MTALIFLLVIGAALWFGLPLIGLRPRVGRERLDTISEFSRAMTALDPSAAARRPAVRGPRR